MGGWTVLKEDATGTAPAPRGGQASIVVGQRMICFGGSDRLATPLADLWVLEAEGKDGGRWRKDPPECRPWKWKRITPISPSGEQMQHRSGSTLVAVGDIVYFFGGQDAATGACFNDLIALDTNTWHWAAVDVPGVKPPGRHSHSAGVLNSRSLVIFGGAGSSGVLGDLWIFDTLTRLWSHPKTTGTSASAREMHVGIMTSSTNMLIHGGRSANGMVLSDVFTFDAEALRWTNYQETPYPRAAHSAVLGPAWAAGIEGTCGEDAPAEGQAVPDNLLSINADAVPDPGPLSVILYGGFDGKAVVNNLLRVILGPLLVEEIEQPEASGKAADQLPQPRFAHAAGIIWPFVSDIGMIVFGGVNPAKDLNEVAIWYQQKKSTSAANSAGREKSIGQEPTQQHQQQEAANNSDEQINQPEQPGVAPLVPASTPEEPAAAPSELSAEPMQQ